MRNVHTDATSERIIASIDFFLFIAKSRLFTCQKKKTEILLLLKQPLKHSYPLQLIYTAMSSPLVRETTKNPDLASQCLRTTYINLF